MSTNLTPFKEVVIAVDLTDGEEVIFVDGDLACVCEQVAMACEIEQLADGLPITISRMFVRNVKEWTGILADLEPITDPVVIYESAFRLGMRTTKVSPNPGACQ